MRKKAICANKIEARFPLERECPESTTNYSLFGKKLQFLIIIQAREARNVTLCSE